MKAKEVGFFSRLGTEPLKRSIVYDLAPGAKAFMTLIPIQMMFIVGHSLGTGQNEGVAIVFSCEGIADILTMVSDLKQKHELAIGNALLRSLEIDAQFHDFGIAGVQPDLIYAISGRRVGIEVATAYYDDFCAKSEWQLARGFSKPDANGRTRIPRKVLQQPDKLIMERVRQELNDKCAKQYSGVDETWLCIEQHAQLASVFETELLIATVIVPPSHFFRHIYLGFHANPGDGGGFRVYSLEKDTDKAMAQ